MWVLFENSIVCLVVLFCCFLPCSDSSCWGVVVCFVRLFFSEWFLFGEFDPGSGRTLAACLTHASRTERLLRGYSSGERVSNTWVICPALRDKLGKLGL